MRRILFVVIRQRGSPHDVYENMYSLSQRKREERERKKMTYTRIKDKW